MKPFFRRTLFLLFSCIFLLLPITAYADRDGNMDGGGSGMGQGTSSDYWTPGHDGIRVTVLDAALYNQASGGALASKLPSIVHRNLPLAIFLEQSDLGIPSWGGSATDRVSDDQILSTLGIGIVSYRPQDPDLEAPDVTYRVNTDVVTSITLTSSTEVTPDNPATVTFHINGRSYTTRNIVMPAGSSQVVWAKWHTPSSPTRLSITVDVSGASTAKTGFIAEIVDLNENIPPDPLATDTNSRFSVPSLPSNPQKTSASWSIWSASWHENWEWESDWDWESGSHSSSCLPDCDSSHGHWVDNGEWVDNGWYDFTSTTYSASLRGASDIAPDDIVPTASGDNMKSGYGIKETATASVSVNSPASHYAPAQTAVSYFPEFDYRSYWRLLTCSGGLNASFQFQPNEYSTYTRQVHFTPVWYPDHTNYTVYTYIIDVWTPVGMLSLNVDDSVQINGSLYDDWYSKRE